MTARDEGVCALGVLGVERRALTGSSPGLRRTQEDVSRLGQRQMGGERRDGENSFSGEGRAIP